MASLAEERRSDLDCRGWGGERDANLDAAMAGPSGSNGAGQGQSGAGDADADGGDQDGDAVDAAMAGLADGEAHVPAGGVKPAHELDEDAVNAMDMSGVAEVTKVARLQGGRTMRDVLQVRSGSLAFFSLNVCPLTRIAPRQKIDYYREHPDPNLASEGESDEYHLIVQANNLSVEIDNEMLLVHKVRFRNDPGQGSSACPLIFHFLTSALPAQFIRDHYLPRFPELDTLVSSPLPYCRVILALGNGPELHGDIAGLLPSGSIMAVKVTAATTKGHQLAEQEWNVVKAACDMMFKLDESKRKVSIRGLS